MREMIKTYAGLRPATGACVICRGAGPFQDAAKGAPEGNAPLCVSETGRLAHFCDEHRPWTFHLAKTWRFA
jgi:hypothetical protein